MGLGTLLGSMFLLMGNGLLSLIALFIPFADSLQLLAPGKIIPFPEQALHAVRLNKSCMKRVMGPAMRFHNGDIVDGVFFTAMLLPLTVLAWFHQTTAQLYVLLVLIAVIGWMTCIQVVYAQIDYKVGSAVPGAPYFFLLLALFFLDIFSIRALDPSYGRFPATFAPVVLAWAVFVNMLAYICSSTIAYRIERIPMTVQIESEKQQVFLNNGNLFPANSNAPTGYGLDSERVKESEDELLGLHYISPYYFFALLASGLSCAIVVANTMSDKYDFLRYQSSTWAITFVVMIVGLLNAYVMGFMKQGLTERASII